MDDQGTFYEDDEPVEDVIDAFARGDHGRTAFPVRWASHGVTLYSPNGVGTPTLAGQPMHPTQK